jgi:hypothetical protein
VVLFAYRADDSQMVIDGLRQIAATTGGERLPGGDRHEWDERFRPMRLKGDRATSSLAFRRPTDAASVVRIALLGFDQDSRTVIPGWANWLMAQGAPIRVPRTTMVRSARRAPAPRLKMETCEPAV